MTVIEIKTKLDEAGVPYAADAKKPALEEIYNLAEEKGLFSQEEAAEDATEVSEDAETEEVREDENDHVTSSWTPAAVKGEGSVEVEVVLEYKSLKNLKHNGKQYHPGDKVMLDAMAARELLASRAVDNLL